ncbi:integrin alpha-PS3 [Drosophila takahashii]|uniref:integrin alpha-PS3 n=1 Tax=Drosophila takahashii TaxID=29030 RepID=UPI001CF878D8|nr:integrin alpha-PS3 [Drosophila takahashii]
MSFFLFLVLLSLKFQTEAFNFSPLANRVIHFPKHLKTHLNQTRSSYFGFSLVMRPNSIFVGAPRAQSTLEPQKDIDEPGAIFGCSLENGTCVPYVLDNEGNTDPKKEWLTLKLKDKYHQWLGGSMDGGTKDTDKLLVCAPRCYNPIPNDTQGRMHGVCYWIGNTLPGRKKVNPITPLQNPDKQVHFDKSSYYYMGEVGFSAHVTDDNSKFVIGAPGIDEWKGAVILHQREKRAYNPLILESAHWRQQEDSYFGYAVSSGYFKIDNQSTLLYVTTAPRAGEAYICDASGRNLSRIHGEQLGEYFGYSVLVEDLNGDGLTDIVVSAPLKARGDSYDIGAIYVFINKGLFNFKQKIIWSPVGSKGRFGTTLSRLGDINHDGYNDVAVGAPFAGNGVVFIYLGSEDGLRDQPSQRLEAPSQQPSPYGSYMFGHGLSRGSDIDGNGFNDLAIGAPNAESLYVYRTYPVVKIHATVRSESREIKPQQDKVKISACYRLSSPAKTKEVQKQELDIRISIDKLLKRVEFPQTQTNEVSFQVNATLDEQCRDFEVKVLYSEKDLVKPIDLEIHYELTNKVPNSEVFCETCAMVDPSEPKTYSTEKISFITGCSTDVCVPDLQLRSEHVKPSYTLGSTNTLRLSYEVTNHGETAYLPQLNVTSSSRLPFAQVPGNCRVRKAVMVCDLNNGRPLVKGDSDSLIITFDVSQLSGDSLIIDAAVISTGIDENSTDNQQTNVIWLKEFAEIDVSGGPTDGQLALKEPPYSAEVINHYEVKSHGPSTIQELTLLFFIPIAFKIDKVVQPIINVNSLKMEATYDSHSLPIKIYDQNHENYDLITTSSRDIDNSTDVEIKDMDNLPTIRTLVLNCKDTNRTICVRSEMRLRMRPNKPVSVNINFKVDLSDVIDPFEYFVLLTDFKFFKKGDPQLSSFVINRKIKPNVIFKNLEAELPIWYLILALIGGLLLLATITYGLHKLGFFKRLKKDELKKLQEEKNLNNDDSRPDQNCNPEELSFEMESHLDNENSEAL